MASKIGGPGGVSGPGGFGKPERTPSPQEKASAAEVKGAINGPAENVQRPMSRFEMVQLQSPAKNWGPVKQEVSKGSPESKSTQKDIKKAIKTPFANLKAFAKSSLEGG